MVSFIQALIVPWNFPCKLCPRTTAGGANQRYDSDLGMYENNARHCNRQHRHCQALEVTPLSILKLAELFTEAGFPPGVVNVIVGYGQTAGQALADHPDVRKVSFTGSTFVGRKIMESASKSNLKRVTLELGGKSPTVIFDDCNLEQPVKWATGAILYVWQNLSTFLYTDNDVLSFHSGQMCAASSRIFVQEGIYDQFVKGLVAAAQSIKQGDGFNPEVPLSYRKLSFR